MRQLSLCDMDQAVRVLLAADPDDWQDICAEILRRAKWADLFRKHTGRALADWGNGSVHDVCLSYDRHVFKYPDVDRYMAALTCFLKTYTDGRHQNS